MKRIQAIVINYITKINDNYIFKVQVDKNIISTCEIVVHLISSKDYRINVGDRVYIDVFKLLNKETIILTHNLIFY